MVIKTVQYWHRNKNLCQRNKIESPETNLHAYGHLLFDKEAKIYNGEKIVSSTSGSGKTG